MSNSIRSRPILIDFSIKNVFGLCWISSLTFLILFLLFRAPVLETRATLAVVDAERVMSSVREEILSRSLYPELVEMEVIEFAKHLQKEIDLLIENGDAKYVVTGKSILAGRAVDYSEYVFVNAKLSYDEDLKTRQSYSGTNTIGLAALEELRP